MALTLPSGPTLTPVHDYWKNHSFDYMNLCCQSDYRILTTKLAQLIKNMAAMWETWI